MMDKDKWHLSQQQKALQQLELDNQLVRQDNVTYSAYYSEYADLKHTIPTFISQIDKRQTQLEDGFTSDFDGKNQNFTENLERLYTSIHKRKMQEAKPMNTRIMLGFAAKMIESVQATQANSDFIAEQKHFRQRYQSFYKYFVLGGD